jgi:ATP-dependent Clp protease protease subunit
MTTKPKLRQKVYKRHNEDDFELPLDLFGMPADNDMLDSTNPIIRVDGNFCPEMARDFIKSISTLKKRGEKVALIEINSDGGCVMSLFRMLNAMDSSGLMFATCNMSHAYSAGGVLLAAGAKGARFVAPLSSTMIHPLSTGIPLQQIEDAVAQTKHDQEISDMLMDRLATYIGISRSKLNKELHKPSEGGAATLWLTPERAVELGVADHVGIPLFQETLELTAVGVEEIKKPKTIRSTK